MFGLKRLWLGAAMAVAVAIVAFGSGTWATSVTPIVIDLLAGGSRMSSVVTVTNTFQTPLPVEMTVSRADFAPTGLVDSGEDSEDLLVFPPTALVPPGESQAFRIQYVGDPLERSRHYYVTVNQLPVQLPQGQSAVQILYNFQIAVGVGVPGQSADLHLRGTEIEVGGDGVPRAVLIVENTGPTYGYISGGRLRVIQRDAAGQEIFNRAYTSAEIQQNIGYGLVGAGGTRRLLIPEALPSAEGAVEAVLTAR